MSAGAASALPRRRSSSSRRRMILFGSAAVAVLMIVWLARRSSATTTTTNPNAPVWDPNQGTYVDPQTGLPIGGGSSSSSAPFDGGGGGASPATPTFDASVPTFGTDATPASSFDPSAPVWDAASQQWIDPATGQPVNQTPAARPPAVPVTPPPSYPVNPYTGKPYNVPPLFTGTDTAGGGYVAGDPVPGGPIVVPGMSEGTTTFTVTPDVITAAQHAQPHVATPTNTVGRAPIATPAPAPAAHKPAPPAPSTERVGGVPVAQAIAIASAPSAAPQPAPRVLTVEASHPTPAVPVVHKSGSRMIAV